MIFMLGLCATVLVQAGTGGASGNEVNSRTCLSSADARIAVAEHQLIFPSIATSKAVSKEQADVLAGKLCRWSEKYVYEMTLLRRDGRVIHAYVDAVSGKIVGAKNID